MDWRRFKTIIIIVLVVINIFFGIYFWHMKISDSRVSNSTRANVISVLEKSNITLKDEDFPKNRKMYSACYVSRLLESDTEFINEIKGKSGTVTVEDELFSFTRKPDKKISLEEENIINECKTFMEECGIYAEVYKEGKVKALENSTKVRFTLTYDGCKFFDSYIDFTVTEKGITKLSGRNIIKKEESLSSYTAELMPVESIIVAVTGDKVADKNIEIKDIDFGYYLGKSAGVYVSVLALPVWKITFDDETALYYDARNGNLITV